MKIYKLHEFFPRDYELCCMTHNNDTLFNKWVPFIHISEWVFESGGHYYYYMLSEDSMTWAKVEFITIYLYGEEFTFLD